MKYKPTHIVGDLHLGSKGLFEKIYYKKFPSIEEHAKGVINNIKYRINEDSVLVFLGDLGYREYFYLLDDIKCYKILILGNHDTYSKDTYYKYFNEVHDTPLFIHPRIVLSHIPIPVEDGVINVHGHTHQIYLRKENYINVTFEEVNYLPVKVKSILNSLTKLEKPSYKFLEEWYKDIQETKEDREDLVRDNTGLILVKETKELIKKQSLKKER